tara:strand:+ start:53 stop:379 length:327 start_codon:yes stop_codon:yes gene_type:complete
MKYISVIFSLILLNILAIITLLYFGNKTRLIEEANNKIQSEINYYNDQIKINEVEFSLHNNYLYLKNLQKIYLDISVDDLNENVRISYSDFINNESINLYKVSSTNLE